MVKPSVKRLGLFAALLPVFAGPVPAMPSGAATDSDTIARHADGWVSVAEYAGASLATGAHLAVASAAAAAAGRGVIVTRPVTITTPVGTISVPIRIEGGGRLVLKVGGSVTLSGALDAPLARVFDASGGGKLTFVAQVANVSPVWWGADVTGAADSTAAIAAAVAAGAGKAVRFAPGTYRIERSIVPPPDTTLTCDGTCRIVPGPGFANAAVRVRSRNVTITGFTFAGFRQALDVNGVDGFTVRAIRVLSATGPGLGVISGSSRVSVLDNVVDAAASMAMSLHDNSDVVVQGNFITNAGDDAIAVRALTTSTNDMTVISGNVIDDAGKAAIKLTVEALYKADVGMGSVRGAQNVRAVIQGNVIRKWGRDVRESAITVDNHLPFGELNQAVSISGNTIESANRLNEMRYISAIHVKDVAITGNVLRGGVSASGIATQDSRYVTIVGNVVGDSCRGASGMDTGGISLLTTTYSTVQGNTVRNPGARAGILAQQSRYNAIIGNVVVDDQGSHTMPYGIELSSLGALKSDFNTVVGNVISGYVTAAMSWGEHQRSQAATTNVGD